MESSFLAGTAEVSTRIVFFFGSSFNWKGKNALTLNAGRERSEPPPRWCWGHHPGGAASFKMQLQGTGTSFQPRHFQAYRERPMEVHNKTCPTHFSCDLRQRLVLGGHHESPCNGEDWKFGVFLSSQPRHLPQVNPEAGSHLFPGTRWVSMCPWGFANLSSHPQFLQ